MACVVAVCHSNKAITVHKFTQLGGLQLEKEARSIVKCVLLRPAMATMATMATSHGDHGDHGDQPWRPWRPAHRSAIRCYPLAVMTG
jgi:hypothetical protein